MQLALIIVLSLHILAGVFWAGTSFALARTGGLGAAQLFLPQMGAALVAVLAGAYLWSLLQAAAFGRVEQVLAVGAGCAVVAAGVQGALCAPAVRALQTNTSDEARARIALGQRIGAGLLAVTVICMAAPRYV